MRKKIEYQVCTNKGTTVDDKYYRTITQARKAAVRNLRRGEWISPNSLPLVIWKLETVEEVHYEDR